MHYQAIPENSILLEKGRVDVDWAESLTNIKTTRLDRIIRMQQEFPKNVFNFEIEFAKEVEKLLSDVPDISERYFFWGRKWAMLEFLLAINYQHKRDYSDFIIMALYGRDLLNPEDDRVRYTPPEEISGIVEYLSTINIERLQERFPELRVEGVYKSNQLPSDDSEAIKQLYDAMKELNFFYQSVLVKGNEGVVAEMF